jgi:hypothetical protein
MTFAFKTRAKMSPLDRVFRVKPLRQQQDRIRTPHEPLG